MSSIRDILQTDAARLNSTLDLGTATARIEVQCLLQSVLKKPRSYLLAHPEQILDAGQNAAYESLLQRRLQGEPIAHILGEREFFGLNFKVTPATLIPRPDTELLVELALQRLLQCSNPSPALPLHPQGVRRRVPRSSAATLPQSGEGAASAPPLTGGGREGFELYMKPLRVLDLGTGTGAIALSIAHSRPDVEVVGVDASPAALQVARENALLLGIGNASFVQSDWFTALTGQRFDLIVSNPPYIAADDEHLTRGDVRFEPMSALASGPDGLDDIRCIAGQAAAFLECGAWLLLEHGYDQADVVRNILKLNGYSEIFSAKDIAGIERISAGMLGK